MADSFGFDAIGTRWRVDTSAPLARGERDGLLRLAEEYDALYSRFREDSGITALAV